MQLMPQIYNFGWLFAIMGLLIALTLPRPFRIPGAYVWALCFLSGYFPEWHSFLGAKGYLPVLMPQETLSFTVLFLTFILFIGIPTPITLRDHWVELLGVAGALLIAFSPNPDQSVLVLGNKRFACAFVVLALGGSSWWNLSLSVLITLVTQSATGMIPLAVYLWFKLPKKVSRSPLAMMLPLGVTAIAAFWVNLPYKFSTRWTIWAHDWAMHHAGMPWWGYAFGHGPGTWAVWGTSTQLADILVSGSQEVAWFPHNDFLQAYFEYGWIGLGLILYALIWLLRKTKSWEARADLIAFCGVSLVQWTTHYMPVLLLGWVFVKEAWQLVPLQKDEK